MSFEIFYCRGRKGLNVVKKMILVLFLFWSVFSFAEEAFFIDKHREALQNKFVSFQDYPILIIDQDEVYWRYIQAGVVTSDSRESRKIREEILGDYVYERIGVRLEKMALSQLEPYTSVMKDGAFALPILDRRGFRLEGYSLCAVFTASANSNKRLEHERLLALRENEYYTPEFQYEDLQYKLTYRQKTLFSLYHELAHCLDSTYMPQLYSYGESAHYVHESESFAESLALLMLYRDGEADESTGLVRAIHRQVYSRTMGPFFAQNTGLGMGHPFFAYGGVIYHLAPSLRETSSIIKRRGGEIREMSTRELIELTEQIVEASALPSRTFHAIRMYYNDPDSDEVLRDYRQKAFESPDFFYESYVGLLEYIDYSSFLLSKAFVPSRRDRAHKQSENLSDLDHESFCYLIDINDKQSFFDLQNHYRVELQEVPTTPQQMRLRSQELNDIGVWCANRFEKRPSLL